MTVVVRYVPTPEGELALSRAGQEARLRDTDLVIVNSTQADSHIAATHPQTNALRHVVAAMEADGVRCQIKDLAGVKDNAAALLEVADEVDASLIVIGLRRRSAVGKLILGSTAQRVLLDAACPVLTVKLRP